MAQISSLQCLEWESSDVLTLDGLQQFAALTALTQLDVAGCVGLAAKYKPMREDSDWLQLETNSMVSRLAVGYVVVCAHQSLHVLYPVFGCALLAVTVLQSMHFLNHSLAFMMQPVVKIQYLQLPYQGKDCV